uniref:Arrestin C-terminal-like domain-containing protein n=1 Tax=Astyanax mexicanus TaxID=7994 RepID=A0A3B1IY28_ASTMX
VKQNLLQFQRYKFFLGEIVNSSTKKIVPKYTIYQKQSFFASGKRSLHISHIVKQKEAALSSISSLTVSKILTIPSGVTPTILNCRILKVEYRIDGSSSERVFSCLYHNRIQCAPQLFPPELSIGTINYCGLKPGVSVS